MKKQYFPLILIFLLFACNDFDYEFEGTNESFEIFSDSVGDSFEIYVYLPPSYSSAQAYPLIIGLDGDSEFPYIKDIVSEQIIQDNIPPSIFVGIGYGSISKNETLRNRDYTPSVSSDLEYNETGGAASFYAFIKDELIPELETKYSIDQSGKTLLGHSFGGLFTLFAMFQDNADNPFDKFIPVAASFWYDAGEIFNYEQHYFNTHTDLPAKVYTTMGSLEGAVMVSSFAEMEARLKKRNYLNLTIHHEILKKYGHSRSDYISYEKGLEYVFNP